MAVFVTLVGVNCDCSVIASLVPAALCSNGPLIRFSIVLLTEFEEKNLPFHMFLVLNVLSAGRVIRERCTVLCF